MTLNLEGTVGVQEIGEMLKQVVTTINNMNVEIQDTSAITEELSAGSDEIQKEYKL